MKKKHQTSCPCCEEDAGFCVFIPRCFGGPDEGVVVTLSQGGIAVGAVTTDATGNACFGLLAAGSYNVSVPAGNGYNAISFNVAVTGGTQTYSPTRNVNSSYACVAFCPNPVPKALTLTDSVYGTTTLGWNGVTIPTQWEGSRFVSYPGGCGACGAVSTIQLKIEYVLKGSVGFPLKAGWNLSDGPPSCCPAAAFGAKFAACDVDLTLAGSECGPIDLLYSGATHSSGSVAHVYCASPTITITA